MHERLEEAGRRLAAATPRDGHAAIVHRRARRLRRRRLAALASVPIAIAVVVVVAVTAWMTSTPDHGEAVRTAEQTTATTTTSPGALSVPPVRTVPGPDGWLVADFRYARLWVPPTWFVALTGESTSCDAGTYVVLLGDRDVGDACDHSAATPAGVVRMAPLSVDAPQGGAVNSINGYDVYPAQGIDGTRTYAVPRLQVLITVTGSVPADVVPESIGASPRGAVLIDSHHAAAPQGWKRVVYRGVSMSIPPDWPVVDAIHGRACHGPFAGSPRVFVGAELGGITIGCPMISPNRLTPRDGLWLRPAQNGSHADDPLTFGPDDGGPTLSFAFGDVAIDLGIGSDPAIARTVFASLERAPGAADTPVEGTCSGGNGGGASPDPERLTEPMTIDNGDITLDPPRPGDEPGVSGERIWNSQDRSSRGTTYRLILARFSSRYPAKPGPNGSLLPLDHDELAWVVYGTPEMTGAGPCGGYSFDAYDAVTGLGILAGGYGIGP